MNDEKPYLQSPSEERYQAIVAALSDGIIVMGREGILEVNQAAQRMLGVQSQRQDGCSAEHPNIFLYSENGHLIPREYHPCQVTLATGQAISNVIIGFQLEAGTVKWISVSTSPVWMSGSKEPDFVVLSIRDIHQDIKRRLALEKAKEECEIRLLSLDGERGRLEEMLFELNRERELREDFVSTLTHDLRTPLTAAVFGAQTLMSSKEQTVRRSAERILGSVKRLDRMIRDLLDANRLKAGQGLPVHLMPCDLGKLIHQACDNLSAIHGERIRVEINQELTIEACSDGLARVLENLVNNAFKYGSSETQVTISLKKNRDEALISVHNYGEPIEDVAALFEPYRRERKENVMAKAGWGLGLTLVKGIVDAHLGSINVSSSQDQGTLFTIHLPLEPLRIDARV